MKHTPGPWRKTYLINIKSSPLPYYLVESEEFGTPVAEVIYWDKKSVGNSHLITAAPEMFDVLEKLVHGPAHKLYETVAEAHKILKRIKGEE